jgi:tetratricopeptide (TPR) repeat protein
VPPGTTRKRWRPQSGPSLSSQGIYTYWQNKGTALRNAERYEEALASYRRAAELRPDKPEVWPNLGRVYLDLDRPRAALNAFNRSIDLEADYGYVEGWVSRARVLVRLGRKREALRAYDRITNMDPDRFKPWFNEAGLLSELGYWEPSSG